MSVLNDQTIAQRRILFGPVAEALAAVAPAGPVVLVGSARTLALVDDDAFSGVAVHRFSGSRTHTPREVVDEAVAFAQKHNAASVVAIGSSSAIDLGKAVADALGKPLVLIPTALGGAEMTRGYGVIESDRKGGGRLRVPPQTVIYDEALLATLPDRELGSIGINAWAHSIEASYARTEHELGGAAALAAGRRLPPLLLQAAQNRSPELHRSLFEAAHLAGFAVDVRSMGLHHAVCHVIGGLTLIPHGINNAIVLPHAIRANARIAPQAVASVAAAFGIPDLAAQSEAISTAFGLPRTFAELGAPPDLPERALPRVMGSRLLANNPALPDQEVVAELLARAYNG